MQLRNHRGLQRALDLKHVGFDIYPVIGRGRGAGGSGRSVTARHGDSRCSKSLDIFRTVDAAASFQRFAISLPFLIRVDWRAGRARNLRNWELSRECISGKEVVRDHCPSHGRSRLPLSHNRIGAGLDSHVWLGFSIYRISCPSIAEI